VIHSGDETEIDLTKIDAAAIGFVFGVDNTPEEAVIYDVKDGILNAGWNGLKVSVPVKPDKKPGHL
jgi:hypothetical protein